MRPNARAILRIAGLVLLLALLAPIHMVTKTIFRQSRWPRRFLAAAAWIIGARVKSDGVPARPHDLLVSNHVNWLDILILGGATGCAFVSKAELGHPLIHWLADQNHTVYVQRSDRRASRAQAVAIAKALEGSRPVILFPEGTTGPGTHLLPFRSTLLEAANFASREVEVRPLAIDYGAVAPQIGWWEESGRDNILKVLGRAGTIPVSVHLLPALNRGGDRKQLAHEAREAIASRLRFKSHPHSPIAVGQ